MDLKSTLPAWTSGWLSSAMKRVGTPGKKVWTNLTNRGDQIIDVARIGYRYQSLVPKKSHAETPALPYTWNKGMVSMMTSSHSTAKVLNQARNCIPDINQSLVRPYCSLGFASRTTREEKQSWVFRVDLHLWPWTTGMLSQQITQPQVIRLEFDTVALFFLFK